VTWIFVSVPTNTASVAEDIHTTAPAVAGCD
jgi:hypothetical protein